MNIRAEVTNRAGEHQVSLATNNVVHTLEIAPKSTGLGSSVNGGELLLLALATCYCNDVYREAAKRGLQVDSVAVEATAEFGAEGEPASNVQYRAKIAGRASEDELRALAYATDRVAEIQNTLRAVIAVELASVEVATP